MAYIKSSEFAQKWGITRQAISKQIKNETIPPSALKKKGMYVYIKIDHPDVLAYEQALIERGLQPKKIEKKETGQSKQPKKQPKKVKRQSTVKKKPQKKEEDLSTVEVKPDAEYELSDDLKKIIDSGKLTLEMVFRLPKVAIEKIDKYEKYKATKIKNDEQKNKLIKRELVDKFMGKIKSIDKNYILSLEDRIVDDLACIFGNTEPGKVQEARLRIHKEAVKILDYRTRELNKFKDIIGEESE
jgi:hypothetical protein